jgi:inorganic pyrophosphatase
MRDVASESLWDLPVGPEPAEAGLATVYAIIETPRNSSNKYEYDPELGVFVLDRVLANSVHFPGDYGYVPSTIADDGDPIDVLVVASGPSQPGMLILVRPLGLLDVMDKGAPDAKIIAVAHGEPRHDGVNHVRDIGAHHIREIEHFFMIYKDLGADEHELEQRIVGWQGPEEARLRIAEAHARWKEGRGTTGEAR